MFIAPTTLQTILLLISVFFMATTTAMLVRSQLRPALIPVSSQTQNYSSGSVYE